jgi:hypothetical protein
MVVQNSQPEPSFERHCYRESEQHVSKHHTKATLPSVSVVGLAVIDERSVHINRITQFYDHEKR